MLSVRYAKKGSHGSPYENKPSGKPISGLPKGY